MWDKHTAQYQHRVAAQFRSTLHNPVPCSTAASAPATPAATTPHTVTCVTRSHAARPTPGGFYLYRVFNLGYNFIVFFVNMFIVFLMMGAFLWLVIAYGANLSIKGGVL